MGALQVPQLTPWQSCLHRRAESRASASTDADDAVKADAADGDGTAWCNPADEELHRHAAWNLDQADALLFGRVTY